MIEAGKVTEAMISYFKGDVKRINHFLKVYGFAKCIGECENLPEDIMYILELAAIVHDIGIKNSEIKYGSSAGKYQEIEGPPEARTLLKSLDVEENVIERVCFLVSRHHTYDDAQDLDYRILIEADFLVNACEDNLSVKAIISGVNKIFRTRTGKRLINDLYIEKNKQPL